MIAVIFEVTPAAGKWDDYLSIAADLKLVLAKIDGFISVERFKSMADPNKLLSLSFWRDEESVRQWRNTEPHRHAQQEGRAEIFEDYRLRVAEVVRDYGMKERGQAPADSKAIHHE